MTQAQRAASIPGGLVAAALLSLVLVALPAAPLAAADPPPVLWVAILDGEGEPFATDVLADLAIDGAGEICATGGSVVSGGEFAATTVFYEPDGSERWRHRYVAPESAGNEQGLAVFLDDTGRCRVTGELSVPSPPGTGPDVLVLEYDPQGNLLWSAGHDGAGGGFDAGVDVTADAGGNVYVVALSTGDETSWDIVTLKYDATGKELWARIFDGPLGAEDRPVEIEVDADGNVYVAGTAAVSNPFGDDFVVIKYDPDGDELWAELVDGGVDGTDRAAALALDAAGHPYVAGRLLPPPGNEWQAGVVKLLPDGSLDWMATAGHPAAGIPEEVHGLALGGDGSAYLVATGSDDVLTARFAATGALVWDHLRDNVTISDLAARPLALDGAGNAYVAGYAGPGNDVAEWLPRLDPQERLEPGDVVGLHAGGVSRRTAGALRVMVISTSPIVAGNDPGEGRRAPYERIAFVGQAPVKVRGPVRAGDLLVASGAGDGTASSVDPEHLALEQARGIVGRALEERAGAGPAPVRALVGLPESAPWAALLANRDRRLREQGAELAALRARLARLEASGSVAAQRAAGPLVAGGAASD